MARIWCLRCNVHHECESDHGPDGHGGSSICCPVQRSEAAIKWEWETVVTDHVPLTDEELAHIELGASIGVLAKPEVQRRLIADLRAARADAKADFDDHLRQLGKVVNERKNLRRKVERLEAELERLRAKL